MGLFPYLRLQTKETDRFYNWRGLSKRKPALVRDFALNSVIGTRGGRRSVQIEDAQRYRSWRPLALNSEDGCFRLNIHSKNACLGPVLSGGAQVVHPSAAVERFVDRCSPSVWLVGKTIWIEESD